MLSCPRCRTPLEPHTVTTDGEGWEVEVDVCAKGCGGIWLEAHDFEVDPAARLLLDKELLNLNISAKKTVNTKAPADCPACRVAMERFDWNNEGIHLDHCPMCKGRWLDGGEVGTIHEQWGKEPIDARGEVELLRTIKSIKKDTDARWTDESFLEWCLKRLMLSSSRRRD